MAQVNDKTQWLFYAIASGGCAALNGVFAKLTTTQLTTTWATGISHMFGMEDPSVIVEYLIRGVRLSESTTDHVMVTDACHSSSSQ